VRVAVVCPYDLDRPGGVQGQARGLAAAFARRGCAVTLLAPGAPSVHGAGRQSLPTPPSPGELVAVRVGRSLGVRANGSVAPLALQPSALARSVAVLRRHAPELLHLHEPLAPGPTWAALLARRRLPVGRAVGTFHRAGGQPYRLLWPAGRLALRALDAVTAVSEAARCTARPVLGQRPCPVLPNGVDLARLAEATPEPTSGPTVLFVGRHEPRKGLEVLLGALERLGPRWPGTLWVVGQGPLTAELRRRYPLGPKVRWWGVVDDATLGRLLRGSHVVAVPALGGESFGVVLLEALAADSVLLASDLPAFRAVAGPHARYLPPGDLEAWARALDQAVQAVQRGLPPADPASLAAGRRWAARFSFDALADRYLASGPGCGDP
jgi:phosphatidylinositol alpha-mannosyltransferase